LYSVDAWRDHALAALLLGTWVRLSSALALDVADLDLAGQFATGRELKGGARWKLACGRSSPHHRVDDDRGDPALTRKRA